VIAGAVVPQGLAVPVIGDVNGDGLLDLIQIARCSSTGAAAVSCCTISGSTTRTSRPKRSM
jgi:hypothetical protein